MPAWSTVRQRFWKNEAIYNPKKYEPDQLERMKKGNAPQRLNKKTGKMESMELHHDSPRRDGGLFDVEPLWPEQYALRDPLRRPKKD